MKPLLIFIFIFNFSFCIFADERMYPQRCIKLLGGVGLRNNIRLIPINENDQSRLQVLFNLKDVQHFFIGEERPDLAKDIVVLEALPGSKRRDVFSGNWRIDYNGQFAGYVYLTVIDPAKFPAEQAGQFMKMDKDELHLELGYALFPRFRGQNIATEAIAALIDFSKNELGAKYVFAATRSENIPSQRVLEKNQFNEVETWMNPFLKWYYKR